MEENCVGWFVEVLYYINILNGSSNTLLSHVSWPSGQLLFVLGLIRQTQGSPRTPATDRSGSWAVGNDRAFFGRVESYLKLQGSNPRWAGTAAPSQRKQTIPTLVGTFLGYCIGIKADINSVTPLETYVWPLIHTRKRNTNRECLQSFC